MHGKRAPSHLHALWDQEHGKVEVWLRQPQQRLNQDAADQLQVHLIWQEIVQPQEAQGLVDVKFASL